MEIELGTITAAQAIRDVHCETWAATYSSLVSREFYDQRLEAHRHRDWRQLIRAQRRVGGGVFVARDATVDLIGFCQFGASVDEDDDPVKVDQIQRLYVHPGHQRSGVGRSLVEHPVRALRAQAKTSASVWVLEADPRAVRFYERTGWVADGARQFDGAFDVVTGESYKVDTSHRAAWIVADAMRVRAVSSAEAIVRD